MEKSPLWEAVKEALRYAVFTAVSVFITTLIEKIKTIPNQEVIVLILTLILRGLDKYKHELLKKKEVGYVSKRFRLIPLPF